MAARSLRGRPDHVVKYLGIAHGELKRGIMLPRAERRHGVVLVLVAVSLVAILGIVAMALDAGLLFSRRRGLQAAADAAALAAAIDLFKNPSDRARPARTFR